jgi:hypothetical protein
MQYAVASNQRTNRCRPQQTVRVRNDAKHHSFPRQREPRTEDRPTRSGTIKN